MPRERTEHSTRRRPRVRVVVVAIVVAAALAAASWTLVDDGCTWVPDVADGIWRQESVVSDEGHYRVVERYGDEFLLYEEDPGTVERLVRRLGLREHPPLDVWVAVCTGERSVDGDDARVRIRIQPDADPFEWTFGVRERRLRRLEEELHGLEGVRDSLALGNLSQWDSHAPEVVLVSGDVAVCLWPRSDLHQGDAVLIRADQAPVRASVLSVWREAFSVALPGDAAALGVRKGQGVERGPRSPPAWPAEERR